MSCTLRLSAAAVLGIGVTLAAAGLAAAASNPLPPDEAYAKTADLQLQGGTPFGAVLISSGRELLVVERKAGPAPFSTVSFGIRDAATGRELRRLRPRTIPGWAPQWDLAADQSRLALAIVHERRQTLAVIDVATDQDVQRFAVPTGHSLNAVAISPDARRVAGAVEGMVSSGVQVWEVQGSAEPREIKSAMAQSIDFSPDGERVLTAFTEMTGLFGGSSDGVAQVWDVGSGRRLTEVRAKDSAFVAAQFSPDGQRILTANRGTDKSPAQVASTATLWDAKTGQALVTIGRGEAPSSSLAFSSDGSLVATASGDRRVSVWDARSGALMARLGPIGTAPRGERVLLEYTPGAYIGLPVGVSGVAATFAGQDASIITTSFDGVLTVWRDVAKLRAADLAAFTANLAQAQAGDAAAMYRLVNAYRNGRGVVKNAALSSSWLARAADAGHAPANVELGQLLVSGGGERQDCIEGGARLRKAASQGDAAAGTALDAVLSPVGGRQGVAAMSPQIQADLLETQIIDVLKRSEYPAFLANLCALEALGHAERLPAEARRELVYHRAVGLQAAGQPRAALAALTQYLNEAGNAGANYTAAIRLLRPLQEAAK